MSRPISLFPHEVRARQIVAMILSFRYAEPGSAMAQVPRDVVRMICGWVKADFTQLLWDGRHVWKLLVTPSFTKRPGWNLFAYQWAVLDCGHFLTACPLCLSFYSGPPGTDNWVCHHKEKTKDYDNRTDLLERLQKKYILPHYE